MKKIMNNIELTSILLLAQKSSKTEKKYLGKLIARQIDSFQLELFVGSKSPVIAEYIESRRKGFINLRALLRKCLLLR